mmetsp:Transcript_47738/g.107442  ORF Transcript_47738/g.107442 Transcript_47738/m.107442 type:complete len:347 (-) Transcript_47738:533-1573(-)
MDEYHVLGHVCGVALHQGRHRPHLVRVSKDLQLTVVLLLESSTARPEHALLKAGALLGAGGRGALLEAGDRAHRGDLVRLVLGSRGSRRQTDLCLKLQRQALWDLRGQVVRPAGHLVIDLVRGRPCRGVHVDTPLREGLGQARQGHVVWPQERGLLHRLGESDDRLPADAHHGEHARRHKVDETPHRKHILNRLRRTTLLANDLWCHPRECTTRDLGILSDAPGQAEIQQLWCGNCLRVLHHDVHSLQVTVNYMRLLNVEVSQGTDDAQEHHVALQDARDVQQLVAVAVVSWHGVKTHDVGVHAHPLDQLQHQHELPVLKVHAGPVKKHDVWVAHLAQDAKLVPYL